MHTFILRLALCHGAAIAFASASTARDSSPTSDETIAPLIRDLGAKDFKVRNNAVKRLTEIEPVSALTAALKSDDPEIARLAAKILEDLDNAATQRSLSHMRAEAERGQAGRFIDRFARWKGSEKDEKSWQQAIDFGWDVANRVLKSNPNLVNGWLSDRPPIKSTKNYGPKDFEGEVVHIHAKERLTITKRFVGFIRADGVLLQRASHGVLVSSDGLETKGEIAGAIVLVLGPARFVSGGGIPKSILICDGEVEITSSIIDSVVIANGPIRCLGAVFSSVLVSSGKITAIEARKSKFPRSLQTVYKENEPNPAGFIKWFATSEVGIEVAAAKDAVKVEKLHERQLPLKAGLKVGDLVTAIDGTKIDSPETFRRRLLRGVANERCTLTLKRGENNVDVLLDFRAEELIRERTKNQEKK